MIRLTGPIIRPQANSPMRSSTGPAPLVVVVVAAFGLELGAFVGRLATLALGSASPV